MEDFKEIGWGFNKALKLIYIPRPLKFFILIKNYNFIILKKKY